MIQDEISQLTTVWPIFGYTGRANFLRHQVQRKITLIAAWIFRRNKKKNESYALTLFFRPF